MKGRPFPKGRPANFAPPEGPARRPFQKSPHSRAKSPPSPPNGFGRTNPPLPRQEASSAAAGPPGGRRRIKAPSRTRPLEGASSKARGRGRFRNRPSAARNRLQALPTALGGQIRLSPATSPPARPQGLLEGARGSRRDLGRAHGASWGFFLAGQLSEKPRVWPERRPAPKRAKPRREPAVAEKSGSGFSPSRLFAP
jgi:hypothetical protein